MNFWDQRFAEPGYKYGTEPNAFLREQAVRLTAPAPISRPPSPSSPTRPRSSR